MSAPEVTGTYDVPDWVERFWANHGDKLVPLRSDAQPVTWADVGTITVPEQSPAD